MEEIVFALLKEKELISPQKGDKTYNEIELQKDGNVIISGNRLGLIMLADYLIEIALSEKEYAHIHLDEINFFDKANAELIIAKQQKSK